MPPDLSPTTADAPAPTAHETLRPSAAHHARFGATAAWAVLTTAGFSAAQVLSHRRTPTAANFKKWAARWGRSILAPAGVHVTVDDRAHLDPSRPYVFVANHQTGLDIFVLAAGLPYPFGFLAKAELASVPFLGVALRNSASIFVDKRDARRAVQSVAAAAGRIRAGMSVLVYAEGKRSYSGGLLPLQRGAFLLAVEAGVPVVPVAVHGAYRLLDERRGLLRAGTVGVVVHEPLPTAGLTRADLPGLMARAEAVLRGSLAAYEAAHPA